MSQEVSNHLLINGAYWGYNPVTHHLLTSWDIQVIQVSWSQVSVCTKITTYKSEDVSKCMVPSQSLTASLPMKSYRAPIGKANVFQAPFFGGRLLFNFRGVFLDERRPSAPGFIQLFYDFWGLPKSSTTFVKAACPMKLRKASTRGATCSSSRVADRFWLEKTHWNSCCCNSAATVA